MRIGVQGADGVLGRVVVERLGAGSDQAVHLDDRGPHDASGTVDAVVHAAPAGAWRRFGDAPGIAAAVRQADVRDAPVDVAAGGWWGGLGTLLAGVAVAEAEDPVELHVAYGLPGARGAYARASAAMRTALVDLATSDGVGRVDGEQVPEPLGEGRRLAWFPAPVGPAHAVAVAGLESLAPIPVPTLRTWFAAGSMAAELLQAVGRLETDRRVGAWLRRRAARVGGGPGATAQVRWAVVVEARERDGRVVRTWANGTDPVVAAADLLVVGARRLAATAGDGTVVAGDERPIATPTGSVLDLGPPQAVLDEVADRRSLRWSVSRPEPSRR